MAFLYLATSRCAHAKGSHWLFILSGIKLLTAACHARCHDARAFDLGPARAARQPGGDTPPGRNGSPSPRGCLVLDLILHLRVSVPNSAGQIISTNLTPRVQILDNTD